jgi:hypothetical protein
MTQLVRVGGPNWIELGMLLGRGKGVWKEALNASGFSRFARYSAILTAGGRHPLAQAQPATWDLVRRLSDQRAAR